MVTAEMNGRRFLPPFVVLDGVTGAQLDQEYKNWASRDPTHSAEVVFQPNHWFDSSITLRYLEWLCAQYRPSEKIGLIWDHAPQHIGADVLVYLKWLED